MHQTNVPLWVAVSSMMDGSAMCLVIGAICCVLSVSLVLCCVPPFFHHHHSWVCQQGTTTIIGSAINNNPKVHRNFQTWAPSLHPSKSNKMQESHFQNFQHLKSYKARDSFNSDQWLNGFCYTYPTRILNINFWATHSYCLKFREFCLEFYRNCILAYVLYTHGFNIIFYGVSELSQTSKMEFLQNIVNGF